MQEESDARKQKGYTELHELSPAAFLRKGLDIEEKQYVSSPSAFSHLTN